MWPVTHSTDLDLASRPWFFSLWFFSFCLRVRGLNAAALWWATRRLPLRCVCWRSVIGRPAGCFDLGLLGAAGAAAAVVGAAFAPAWAGTLGARLHQDNGAVVLGAEVGAVWRAVVRTHSGELDLECVGELRWRVGENSQWRHINRGVDYLKWLRYAHDGARVVAIVTQDEVARAFGQLFLRKGYLEHDSSESVKWQRGKKDDTSRGFSLSRPGYLVLLSKVISLLLLGPHVSHVVLVMLEAHLRDSGALTNSTSLKETRDNGHFNGHFKHRTIPRKAFLVSIYWRT